MQGEEEKVHVTVFYEALCPDSKNFIVEELYPLWQDLSHIVQLDMYAFGKATVSFCFVLVGINVITDSKHYTFIFTMFLRDKSRG